MIDRFEQQIEAARQQLRRSCARPRYRVAWLCGPPQSGKSIMARRIAAHNSWRYLDYTLTPGYFDRRASDLVSYRPDAFIDDLRAWCDATAEPVLIADEVDALLAFWDDERRRIWAADIARLAGLDRGLVLVTHFFSAAQLQRYLPDNDIHFCFDLAGRQ